MLQNNYFSILAFLGLFLAKKTTKIDQKWRKLVKSKLFENFFWNLVCKSFQTKENSTKKLFFILAFFGQKITKIGKIQTVDEIFWNLVGRCFITKENATKKLFFYFGIFGPFLAKKQLKLTKKEENWQNPDALIKFSKIWYIKASKQKKIQQKNCFLF